MINVSILYPIKEGGYFDLEYYLKTHMPLSIEKLRPALRGVSIEHGFGTAGSDAPPAFTVICQLSFDSVEAFFEVFSPHAEWLQGDIKNYTDLDPVIQFSEVKLLEQSLMP